MVEALNKEQNVQECDANAAEYRWEAGYIILN
jgi:hypothetical protein